MTHYFPSFDQLRALLGVDKSELQRQGRVLVRSDVLMALIKTALSGLTIDPQIYRSYNPDVDKVFKSLSDALVERHFKETGYFEDRRVPLAVDVQYYQETYPDLATAVKRGALTDLKKHFYEVGFVEKRTPSAAADEEMKSWTQLEKSRGIQRSS